MRVIPYHKDFKQLWDQWIDHSKNGTFLLKREFMDYHAERFCDASLLFFKDKQIIGILPANVVKEEGTVTSHGGLTYGGLIMGKSATGTMVLEMLTAAIDFYRSELGLRHLRYKPTPYIYHRYPAEEDIYALFRLKASLFSRSLSSCIQLDTPLHLSSLRCRGIKKAEKAGLKVTEVEATNTNIDSFWTILSEVLSLRHGTRPVHRIDEIRKLATNFPNEIKFFLVKEGENVVGGCVTFECNQVAHIQYIAASDIGRTTGALDLLFSKLITHFTEDGFLYLDFGISTEQGGAKLNEGLLHQKEGFGGRGICYDCYKIDFE
ncbi:MAG: GNAT family N-acetyltransferase [Bacteroidaceae bacterium]